MGPTVLDLRYRRIGEKGEWILLRPRESIFGVADPDAQRIRSTLRRYSEPMCQKASWCAESHHFKWTRS